LQSLKILEIRCITFLSQYILDSQTIYLSALPAYSIWEEGKMKACCFYRPEIRFGKGASIYFESVDYSTLKEKIQAFGESLNFHGQLSFDFIDKNGKYYVLECNPRATSGAHLFSNKLAAIFFEKDLISKTNPKPKGLKFLMLMNNPSLLFSSKYHNTKDVLYFTKDLMPMLMQVFSIFEVILLAWRKDLTLLEATTFDIEWNGEDMT